MAKKVDDEEGDVKVREDEDVDVKVREVVRESQAKEAPLDARAEDLRDKDLAWARKAAGAKPQAEQDAERAQREAQLKAANERALKANQTSTAYLEELFNTPPPKPVEPPQYKDIKPRPPVNRGNPMLAFQNAGTLLALAASGLSRRPLTAAFSAAAGAMEGYMEGDDVRVRGELAAWKESNEAIRQQNDIETSRFNAIVSAKNLSFNEKVQRVGLANMIELNYTRQHALETGSLKAAEEFQKHQNDQVINYLRIAEQTRSHLEASADRKDRQAQLKLQFEEQQQRFRRDQAERERHNREEEERKRADLERKTAADAAKKHEAKYGDWKGQTGQRQALVFANQLEEGEAEMKEALDKGYRPNVPDSLINDLLADPSRGANAGIGSRIGGKLGNYFLSEDAQQFYNGARKVQAAILHSETGKAFNAGEVRDVAQRYIQQPGDAISKQKMNALDKYRNLMYAGTGLPSKAWSYVNSTRLLAGQDLLVLPPDETVKQARDAIKLGASRTEIMQDIRNMGYLVPPDL